MEKEKIAFNSAESFKKAIPVDEFESVLLVLESTYKRCKNFTDQRSNVLKLAKEKLNEMKESHPSMKEEISDAVKSSKAMLYDLDKEAYNGMKVELEGIGPITEFLNTFKVPEKYLETLDISFINKFKK
jgi:hypothetical protein